MQIAGKSARIHRHRHPNTPNTCTSHARHTNGHRFGALGETERYGRSHQATVSPSPRFRKSVIRMRVSVCDVLRTCVRLWVCVGVRAMRLSERANAMSASVLGLHVCEHNFHEKNIAKRHSICLTLSSLCAFFLSATQPNRHDVGVVSSSAHHS